MVKENATSKVLVHAFIQGRKLLVDALLLRVYEGFHLKLAEVVELHSLLVVLVDEGDVYLVSEGGKEDFALVIGGVEQGRQEEPIQLPDFNGLAETAFVISS